MQRDGQSIAYATLDHAHLMAFTDSLRPTPERRSTVADPASGNHALMRDHLGHSISHPRGCFIAGHDAQTGEPPCHASTPNPSCGESRAVCRGKHSQPTLPHSVTHPASTVLLPGCPGLALSKLFATVLVLERSHGTRRIGLLRHRYQWLAETHNDRRPPLLYRAFRQLAARLWVHHHRRQCQGLQPCRHSIRRTYQCDDCRLRHAHGTAARQPAERDPGQSAAHGGWPVTGEECGQVNERTY